jgi:hypothetical protein
MAKAYYVHTDISTAKALLGKSPEDYVEYLVNEMPLEARIEYVNWYMRKYSWFTRFSLRYLSTRKERESWAIRQSYYLNEFERKAAGAPYHKEIADA